MSTKANVLTPTGRMLWGSLYEPQTKDADGKPLVIKTGPDAGKPTQRYAFGVGIPKGAERHWAETPWGAPIWATGHAGFPQQAQSPSFAWKVTDGDSTVPNKNGKRPCDKEGYPGHWVLSFSSSFAPRVFNKDGSAPIAEPGAVKCGYYIQVAGTVDSNGSTQNPGVYLNHNMVALQGYGTEIVSGPDAASVGFGQGPAPVGMQAAPVGGLVAPPAPVGAPTAAPAPPPPAPAPVAALVPPLPVTPAPSFLAPAGVAPPPPPVAAPPPAAPAGPVMTAKANGATYAAMIAAGWTEATLRQHGYLA
jgi:hypothetical protein